MPDYIPIELIITDFPPYPEEQIKPIRESISEKGLMHPLLVCEFFFPTDPDDEDMKFKLIAGKKRLQALRELKTKEVPVKIYSSNLTDDQLLEINLDENLKRGHLPWYDRIQQELGLHELRQRIHGKAIKGKKERIGWTLQNTADELEIALGVLSEDLKLARAVSQNPSLKNVKDKSTALRLIKTEVKRQEAEAFALIPSEFEMNQVFLGDSASILKQIPDRTFDVCITDPPWSTYERGEGNEATLVSSQEPLLPIFKEIFRVLKNDSFLYLITSSVDLPFYMKELSLIGFKTQQYPLIWQKTRNITHGRRNWEYARDYEPIILATKGNPVLTSQTEISSILSYSNLHYTKMIHPNEKPPELLEQIIKNCSYEGSSILDPFSGSGVTLDVAKKLKRNYIGIEENRKFYDKIVERLGK